jgi:two-component sensor histidine kinase
MNSIPAHRRMPDKLAHQRVHGIDNFTAEESELLQQQDEAALHRANAHVEHLVQTRTAELAQTNAALQAENQAHKQVEREQTQRLVREQVLRRRLEAQLRAALHRRKRCCSRRCITASKTTCRWSLPPRHAGGHHRGSLQTLFEDSQQRSQSIGLIHESLYQSGDVVAQVNATDYLPRLSHRLFEGYRSPSDPQRPSHPKRSG